MKHERKYIQSCVDEAAVLEQANKIYERRLQAERHYEYQPVFVDHGTIAGMDLLVEVEGNYVSGIILR